MTRTHMAHGQQAVAVQSGRITLMDMRRQISLTLVLGLAGFTLRAQEQAGKMEFGNGLVRFVQKTAAQDASWKMEIDNSLVQVARRWLAPHQTVSAADMPPALLVFLTDYSVRLTTSARREELRRMPAEFLWHAGGRMRLENLLDAGLEVVQVGLKFSPASEEVASVLSSRSLVFENDFLHVKHLHFVPGRQPAGGAANLTVDPVLPAVVIHLSAALVNLRQADAWLTR